MNQNRVYTPRDFASPREREREDDPQIVVTGVLKQGERSDVIVFELPLALFKLICIVTVPGEGTTSAPVYIKFRVTR